MINLYFGVVNEKYPTKDITVGEVAIINEYGTEDIPPRPAFTMGLEKSIKKHKKLIDASLKNITNHLLTGRTASIERQFTQAFTQIGKTAKKETKEIIKQGTTTPNAESTIKRKGFDHPLWETGLLYESVDYKVGK
jgi:hypothetical protein